MPDARVAGIEQLARLNGALRQADPEMRKAFTRALRYTARKGIADVKDASLEKLPKEHGLNEWLRDAKFGVRITAQGKHATLRIVATKIGHDIYAFDKGVFRHPVFPNSGIRKQWRWSPQIVTPGFFSETLEDERGQITLSLLRDMSHFTSSLARIGH